MAAIKVDGAKLGGNLPEVTEAIVAVFKAGRKHGMDQETVRHALAAVSQGASLNTSINNSTFNGIR